MKTTCRTSITPLILAGAVLAGCQQATTGPGSPDFAVNGCEPGPPASLGGGKPDHAGPPPDVGCRPVASVQVSPAAATVEPNETVQLDAIVRDRRDNLITNRVVTWMSADEEVATVDQGGVVTGVGVGQVVVEAVVEDQVGAAVITVVYPSECDLLSGEFWSQALFEQATSTLTLIDFDKEPDGTPIHAPSPGVRAGTQYSSVGVTFAAGVIFGEPNLPFSGVSPPNVISNSGINSPTPALVDASFTTHVCAVGITNTGATAILRIFDPAGGLIASITSDADVGTKDFIGLVSATRIERFEFDYVSGVGFEGDNLLIGR